jgi:signal transduction histidine kinase
MTTTRRTPSSGRDHAALLHELEVHQAELHLQIEELQASNEALRRSNEEVVAASLRFRSLYELAPTPYITIDDRRSIVDLNSAGQVLLDAPRERLVGGTIDLFVDDASRGRFRAFVDVVFAKGKARCADVVLVRADQVPVDALVDGVILREVATDAPPRCVLAIVDITARKLAEIARRRAQDEVLAVVSHDLRGPLNAIGLACQALAHGIGPDDQRKCIDAIERSSARCERLIKDLLGISHIESGRLTLNLAQFDARDLVRQTCRDYEPAAAAAGASITTAIAPVPQPIVGDRDRLHQVLSNLIGNALVHARGAAIEISIATRGDDVVIAVADEGPGIPTGEIALVFERYRQGADHRGGAGLGLAIVKGLVEAHHGTVSVTSPPGHGARFEVVLPRADSVARSRP